jgi:RND family efflux transporter MFP subunit
MPHASDIAAHSQARTESGETKWLGGLHAWGASRRAPRCTPSASAYDTAALDAHRARATRVPTTARSGAIVLAVCMALDLGGCKPKQPAVESPPPPAVTVALPVQQDVIEWDAYTGYLESPQSVNVSARVSGMIVDSPFLEGAVVRKGQLLFVIDERPFKADLDSKLADQERAEAQLAIAVLNFSRLEQAIKSNAVSRQDYDNAKAASEQAKAVLAAARAAVDSSRLNVEWCQVTSPIDGRVSSKIVTVGNLVNGGAGQATVLTTVLSIDPMYCYIDLDERSVLKYQKLAAEKRLANLRTGQLPCVAQLANETGFPHAGTLDFADNRVDMATGTMRARGVLPNPSGQLTPGFYVSVRLHGSGRYRALLVPDIAIGSDQDQRNVLVVNKDDVVEARAVRLGALFGNLRAITSGLDADERVVTNGQMRAHPGTKVAPTEVPITVDPAILAEPAPSSPPVDAGAAAKSGPKPNARPLAQPAPGHSP